MALCSLSVLPGRLHCSYHLPTSSFTYSKQTTFSVAGTKYLLCHGSTQNCLHRSSNLKAINIQVGWLTHYCVESFHFSKWQKLTYNSSDWRFKMAPLCIRCVAETHGNKIGLQVKLWEQLRHLRRGTGVDWGSYYSHSFCLFLISLCVFCFSPIFKQVVCSSLCFLASTPHKSKWHPEATTPNWKLPVH